MYDKCDKWATIDFAATSIPLYVPKKLVNGVLSFRKVGDGDPPPPSSGYFAEGINYMPNTDSSDLKGYILSFSCPVATVI